MKLFRQEKVHPEFRAEFRNSAFYSRPKLWTFSTKYWTFQKTYGFLTKTVGIFNQFVAFSSEVVYLFVKIVNRFS